MNIFKLLNEPYHLPSKVKLFEAFSGIGCQRMAFERANIDYEVVGISEIDKYALKSYQAMHGECPNFGSITEIKGKDLPQIDVFTWSFPCTDLSKAGKQKGLTNTRSGLVYEVLRILQECKVSDNLPKVLIMENVVDLVQVKFIRQFQEIQLELENLGYTNYTQTLNAKDYGVAQNRDRVFMVSILGDYYYEFPLKIKLDKRLKDYLESEVDEKYYLSEAMLTCFTDMTNRNGLIRGDRFNPHDEENSKYAFAITTLAGNRATDNFIKEPVCLNSKIDGKRPSRQDRIYDSESISTCVTTSFMPYITVPEDTKQGYAKAYDGDGVYINRPHQKRGVVQDQMIQTLKTSGCDVGVVLDGNEKYISERLEEFKVKNGYYPELFNPYNKQELDELSPTITTMCDRWQSSSTVTINNNLRIRKLTPLECWRLMGIDDKDFNKAKLVNSNAQLYKQAGNGIVVDVFAAIVKQLL